MGSWAHGHIWISHWAADPPKQPKISRLSTTLLTSPQRIVLIPVTGDSVIHCNHWARPNECKNMFTGLQLPTNKLRVSGIRLGLPTSITTKIKQVLHRVPWHPLVTKSQWRRFSGGKSRWRLQGRSEKYLHMVPVPWPFHVWGTQTSHQQPTKQGAE